MNDCPKMKAKQNVAMPTLHIQTLHGEFEMLLCGVNEVAENRQDEEALTSVYENRFCIKY